MTVYKNPICYSVWRFKEYFLHEEEHRQSTQYKNHVHATPVQLSSATTAEASPDCGCNDQPADSCKLEKSSV